MWRGTVVMALAYIIGRLTYQADHNGVRFTVVLVYWHSAEPRSKQHLTKKMEWSRMVFTPEKFHSRAASIWSPCISGAWATFSGLRSWGVSSIARDRIYGHLTHVYIHLIFEILEYWRSFEEIPFVVWPSDVWDLRAIRSVFDFCGSHNFECTQAATLEGLWNP